MITAANVYRVNFMVFISFLIHSFFTLVLRFFLGESAAIETAAGTSTAGFAVTGTWGRFLRGKLLSGLRWQAWDVL